ncbi:retrovirus-related pol polyprotein from transposon TNT 1-94 [Tanacetum coccineum]
MSPKPGDQNREVPVNETFHEQTDDELTEKELKQEIWLHVQQMIKGSDIGIQEKKADYTQLYDFLKYNQKEVDDLRAERLAKTHDPLALMANSNNPFNYPVFHPDQPSSSTYMQQPQPNNNYNPQPSFNQNYMQQPMPNPEDITDPTTAINMALVLMAKAFKLNYSTPTNNNQRISSNPRNRQIAQPGMNMGQDRQMQMVGGNGGNQFRQIRAFKNVGNQNRPIIVPRIANQIPNGNVNVVAARAEGNANVNNHNQIRCYNCRGLGHLARNCTVRPMRRDDAYLQTHKHRQRVLRLTKLPSMIQTDQLSMEQSWGTVDQHPVTVEETRAYFETLYNNLAIEVDKVNMVNRKLRETNADLTTELARYKNQEWCFKISQEKYDKIESLSKEKSTVSSLLEEKKKLKSDFKIREDELLDKQIQLENKIKELDNILVKTEAAKFVRDFKSLAKEVDESLTKHKALELEIERLLREVVSQDIMSIVQSNYVVDTSNLQTELDPYNDMQQKIERLQAQLGDQKGKSKDTLCVSNTLDPLSQKLENENVELESHVLNYAKENAHLKTTYNNLFDSIYVT